MLKTFKNWVKQIIKARTEFFGKPRNENLSSELRRYGTIFRTIINFLQLMDIILF